jgi:hypothetical protein
MIQRCAAILCLLLLLGFGLAGCTKCGWAWEQGGRACHPHQTR